HRLSTLARMRREGLVLVVQDTLRLGSEAGGAEALRLRTSLAFSAQGLPLGILEAATLGGKDQAAFVDTQDDGWAAIREAQHRCPKSRIVTIGDCEGKMAAFFEGVLQLKCGALIRAKGNETQLRPYLQALPEAGEVALFPAREGARSAQLGVRFARLAAKPDLPLWA